MHWIAEEDVEALFFILHIFHMFLWELPYLPHNQYTCSTAVLQNLSSSTSKACVKKAKKIEKHHSDIIWIDFYLTVHTGRFITGTFFDC